MRWRSMVLAALLSASACASAAHSGQPAGRWHFEDASRPVKVVVLGGSIARYGHGGFAQFVASACNRVEVVNRAKSKLGAKALKERFIAQVLRNPRLDVASEEAVWLLFLGGLNSIYAAERTNAHIAEIFRRAHDANIRTFGLTIAPWGSRTDTRWGGDKGLDYLARSQLAVDFMMGRLSPAEALGRHAGRDPQAGWAPGELPDVAVDLWESPLRDRGAPPYADSALRGVAKSRSAKRALRGVGEAKRAGVVARLMTQARTLPSYFMKRAYRGFDAIHPSSAGHKVIAQTLCPEAPASWGCDCQALDGMRWDRRKRQILSEPRVSGPRDASTRR